MLIVIIYIIWRRWLQCSIFMLVHGNGGDGDGDDVGEGVAGDGVGEGLVATSMSMLVQDS